MYAGHIARQDPDEHWAAAAFRWRSIAWWSQYRMCLQHQTIGQQGRRLLHIGPMCRLDEPLADAFAIADRAGALPDDAARTSWWQLATWRDAFRSLRGG